jgi:glucosamine-6-phosphate deaminase
MKNECIDRMKVNVYENRFCLGEAAAADVASKIKELMLIKEHVRIVFAAAPSQNEFLTALVNSPEINWSRITAFHMDEYIGLAPEAPQRFGQFLSNHLFNRVHLSAVHFIDSTNSAKEECERYSELLSESPIDIVCLGIGENGHIAFNDPPVANFNDPEIMKPVQLDELCRQQQVNDGCFSNLDDVPTHALTLTIPTLMSGSHLFCIVPGSRKRKALKQSLFDPIKTDCPASILRSHPSCTLYADLDSYGC